MSQSPPPDWPPTGQNPFSDDASPFGPGGPYPPRYGPPPRGIEDEPVMRWLLPVGTSLWAIAAGYFGLFSLLCLPGPAAIFCGVMAIRDLRRNPKLSGWGRAIFGIAMGTLGTLMLVASVVMATIDAAFEK